MRSRETWHWTSCKRWATIGSVRKESAMTDTSDTTDTRSRLGLAELIDGIRHAPGRQPIRAPPLSWLPTSSSSCARVHDPIDSAKRPTAGVERCPRPFLLIQHPEGAAPGDGVTGLARDVAAAVRTGRDAAEDAAERARRRSARRDQAAFPNQLRELTHEYGRSTNHVTRPRPELLHLTRWLRHW
jgi:hypothetical protein